MGEEALDELNPSIIQLARRSIIRCHLPPALPVRSSAYRHRRYRPRMSFFDSTIARFSTSMTTVFTRGARSPIKLLKAADAFPGFNQS